MRQTPNPFFHISCCYNKGSRKSTIAGTCSTGAYVRWPRVHRLSLVSVGPVMVKTSVFNDDINDDSVCWRFNPRRPANPATRVGATLAPAASIALNSPFFDAQIVQNIANEGLEHQMRTYLDVAAESEECG